MTKSRLPLILPVAAALALTACSPMPTATEPATAQPDAPAGHADYPLTIKNCGIQVTFDAPPEHVLAIKSTSIEMLLALGLEDRIIGTAFPDGPVAEEWAGAAEDLEQLSDKVPGVETVLDLSPDLVYAGWESNLTAEGAGDREMLASVGVNGYVSSAACTDPAVRPTPLTFDDVFAEINEVGAIFDAQDAAATLVDDQRARLNAIEPDDRRLTALWFSSGSETPYVGAGVGAPQMVMDAVGLTNIAADVPETWSSIGWETVVAADPDVIVLVDSAWGSTEKKISVLESNPATAALSAVVNERYLVIPFPTSEAGVRSVEAVERLSDQLAELP
jgi:iron complex transport system substrate-binding protein